MTGSLFTQLVSRGAERVDRAVGWSKLPTPLAVPVLIGLRHAAREATLRHRPRPRSTSRPSTDPSQRDHLTARTLDGTYNDLNDPLMGCIGSRFGRNVPIENTYPEAARSAARAEPAPGQPRAADARGVRAGDHAEPAGGGVDPVRGARLVQPRRQRPRPPWEIPLEKDDPWPQHPMQILRTRPDPSGDPGRPPTYVTADTHWWDGSQIYGSDPAFAARAAQRRARQAARSTSRACRPSELERTST